MKNLLHMFVESRLDMSRVGAVLIALLSLAFCTGASEYGPGAIWHFALIDAFCILFIIRRTIAGWIVVLIPFSIIVVYMLLSGPRNSMAEWILGLAIYGVPAVVHLFSWHKLWFWNSEARFSRDVTD